MNHSRITGSLLDELAGRVDGRPAPDTAVARWAPTVRKISDDRAVVEDIVALLDDEGMPGIRRSRVMQRQRNRSALGTTESGTIEFESRRCCAETILAVDRRLHLLKLPYQFTCETCGTVFEIAHQMR